MSIELKLQAILETKAALQAALNLPNSVPFSQYAGRINWKDETPPSDLLFADYTKDRYSVSGVPVGFSDVNEFTRLTAATNFVGGELVEYAANKPRIETGKGLLVEPSATNIIRYNTTMEGFQAQAGISAISVVDDTVGHAVELSCSSQVDSFTMYTHPREITVTIKGTYRSLLVHKSSSKYITIATLGGAGYGATINIETLEMVRNSNLVSFKIEDKGEWINIQLINPATSNQTLLNYQIAFGNERGGTGTGAELVAKVGDFCKVALPMFIDTSDVTQSIIKTSEAPATRSPDLNRITVPLGKTLTLDADAGVTYIMENATTALITATEPGYIRSARVN